MTWSYVKKGISTDQEKLLWDMHNQFVENTEKDWYFESKSRYPEKPIKPINNIEAFEKTEDPDMEEVEHFTIPSYDICFYLILVCAFMILYYAWIENGKKMNKNMYMYIGIVVLVICYYVYK